MNRSILYGRLADLELSEGQYAQAQEGYSKELAVAERLLKSPRTREYTEVARKSFVARALNSLAWSTFQLGRIEESLAMFDRSAGLYEAVMATDRSAEILGRAAEIQVSMAKVQQRNKAERLAIGHFEQTAVLRREMLNLEPRNMAYRLELSRAIDALGDAQFFLGELADAKRSNDESLALTKALSEPPEQMAIRRSLSLMLYRLATCSTDWRRWN
jgi:tetratricopeptide (TPR) repeat protein